MRRIADRKGEVELFTRMLRGAEPARILLLEGPSERGKSILLAELARVAEEVLGPGNCARADLKGGLPLGDLFSTFGADLGTQVFTSYSRPAVAVPIHVDIEVDASGARFRDHNQFSVQPVIQAVARDPVPQQGEAVVCDLRACPKPLVLIVDTFEAATDEASRWITQKLLPTVRHNARLCIVMAGQRVPDHRASLLAWGELAAHRELLPVTSVDDWYELACARHSAFPRHHIETVCIGGLANRPSIIQEVIENIIRQLPPENAGRSVAVKPEEAIQLLLDAGGDEEKLTLAAVEIAIAGQPEEQQARLRETMNAAAVPHWFDPKILAALLGGISLEEARSLNETLRGFSFVENFAARGASNVHERTRLALLKWMAREQPAKFQEFSGRAVEHFGRSSQPHDQVEWIYHLLTADPDTGSYRLANVFDAWYGQGRIERLQSLNVVLNEHLSGNRLQGRALAMTSHIVAIIERSYVPLARTEARLSKALTVYRELGEERGESAVLNDIGEVQEGQRRLDDALSTYQDVLKIREKLAALQPEESRWQRDLSVSYNMVGSVQKEKGLWDEALNSFQAALTIRETLAAKNPENTQAQRDLSISHHHVGMVQQNQNLLDEARGSFEAARNKIESLVASDQSNTLLQRDLSIYNNKVGLVERAQGRKEEARHSFETSLAIVEKLVAQDPGNTLWLRDASYSHQNLGMAQQDLGLLDEAFDSLNKALQIREKLAAHDADNLLSQADLAYSRWCVAEITAARQTPPLP